MEHHITDAVKMGMEIEVAEADSTTGATGATGDDFFTTNTLTEEYSFWDLVPTPEWESENVPALQNVDMDMGAALNALADIAEGERAESERRYSMGEVDTLYLAADVGLVDDMDRNAMNELSVMDTLMTQQMLQQNISCKDTLNALNTEPDSTTTFDLILY